MTLTWAGRMSGGMGDKEACGVTEMEGHGRWGDKR